MRLQPFLTATLRPNDVSEVTASTQNVKLNGVLFDFRFTPDADYITGNATKSPYRILKNIKVNLNRRTGSVTGGDNSLIMDKVSLYTLMEYSDFIAGLDITQSEMEADKEWRACGYVPIGYLPVMENDSLDIQVYCKQNPESAGKLIVSTVLHDRTGVNLLTYKETEPSGSSQTFENVLGAFISTEDTTNETISTTDYLANEVVGIESAIAWSNSVGNFEKFKRFGQFYADEFNVGQSLTFNCPKLEDSTILLCCRDYNVSTQISGDSENVSDGRSLFTRIASQSPAKFKALKIAGANTFGVIQEG